MINPIKTTRVALLRASMSFADPKSLGEALDVFERKIRDRSREHIGVFDSSGRLLDLNIGCKDRVLLPDVYGPHSETWTVTHNHPGKIDLPPSLNDAYRMLRKELRNLRVVNFIHRYSLHIPPPHTPAVWHELSKIAEELWQDLQKQGKSKAEIVDNALGLQLLWPEASKKLGWTYKKERWPDR